MVTFVHRPRSPVVVATVDNDVVVVFDVVVAVSVVAIVVSIVVAVVVVSVVAVVVVVVGANDADGADQSVIFLSIFRRD